MTGQPITIYPVGVLAALQRAYRFAIHGRAVMPVLPTNTTRASLITHTLTREARYVGRALRARNWRRARQSFNGYLAEPSWDDNGPTWTRCGHGWTRRRALRDLQQHLGATQIRQLT
jgi:hypothetical protein